MRTFTFKSLFLTVLFVLLGSLAIQAADDGLITRQITLKLDEAGTLPNMISYDQKNLITNLKIVGKINGTDLNFIREMAGCDYDRKETDGKLSILDLSDAKIVEGGSPYTWDKYGDTTYIIPRPTPIKTTRLPKETKVYFNPFFITFYFLVVFRGTKIVNLSETA